jgi:hypothetical protein
VQDAKHLPELVAQIHSHAHDDDRSYPSAGLTESWCAPHQEHTQGAKCRHGEHLDPHRPIVPLQEAALAVAAVAAVAVSRIQRMCAAPTIFSVAHEAYPEVRSQMCPLSMLSMQQILA